MHETPNFLADRLRTEGEKTAAFFAGLESEQWMVEVYTEGETWTVRSVLSHFVSAEKGFLRIFENILAGGPGASDDFDIDRYNESQQKKTRELTPMELLEQFKSVRGQMIVLVSSMSEADMTKQGRHPYLGLTTLSEMIKMIYRHNQIHYRDLRTILDKQ